MSRTFVFRYQQCRHDSEALRYDFDKEITEDTTIICHMRNFCSYCMSADPPPGGGAFTGPTEAEARRVQDIWDRLAQNPGFIDPVHDLDGFEQRDYKFMTYIMNVLENDLHHRWAHRHSPQPAFEQRQLVLQVRHVVQRMFIERTMQKKELPNGGSGDWQIALEEPRNFLLTDVSLEELQEDEKDCVICAETFGVANENGMIAMPCRTPCLHLFCRSCLLLHIRKSSERSPDDDDNEGADEPENSESWSLSNHSDDGADSVRSESADSGHSGRSDNSTYSQYGADQVCSESADSGHSGHSDNSTYSQYDADSVRSESADSGHSGRSDDSRYTQHTTTSEYIPSTGWPRCPLCNLDLNMEEYLGPAEEVEDPDHESPLWMQIFRPECREDERQDRFDG